MNIVPNIKKRILIFFLISLSIFWTKVGFCGAKETAAEVLYNLGKEHYKHGALHDALHEFKKATLIASDYKDTAKYIELINKELNNSKTLDNSNIEERLKKETDELVKLEQREKAISLSLDKTEGSLKQEKKKTIIAQKDILVEREIPNAEELPRKVISIESKNRPLAEKNEATEKKESEREVSLEPLRPGFERYYEEGTGFKLTKFLGVAAYTEIFEEPNPIDDYISEVKELNRRDDDRMRDMLTPLFTRAFAAKVVLDYKDWPRLSYTFDKRTVLHEFDTKYAIKDQRWQTNEVDLLYTLPKIKYIGTVTLNPVYKRIVLSSEDDTNSAEDRNEYMLNFTLSPFENFEIYGKVDYFEGKKLNTTWVSKPEQWLYKSELRLRFPNYKLSITPGYSFSQTRYLPTDDIYKKEEMYVDIGKELTKRLSLSIKPEMVFSETIWPNKSPSNVEADVVEVENEFSYNLFRDYYINASLDWAHGINFDNFDNVGPGIEFEYFKPSFLRWKVGYQRCQYYNLDDDVDTVYFKIYFFM